MCHKWHGHVLARAAVKIAVGALLLIVVVRDVEPGFARPVLVAKTTKLPDDLRPVNPDLRDLADSAYSGLVVQDGSHQDLCADLLHEIASEDPVLAAAWLHEMRERKTEPSPDCYEAVIESTSRQGLAAQASATLAAMGSPSAAAYRNVIQALARCGDVQGVQARIADMKAAGIDFDGSVLTAIEAVARTGDSASARLLLEEATRSGCSPDVQAFTAAISACAKEGKFAQAEAVFDLMQAHDVAPDADAWAWLLVANAAEVQARRRQTTSPEQIFRRMVESGVAPTSFAFRALRRAVGLEKGAQLCKELGLGTRVASRVRKSSKPQRRWHIQKRPYKDGYRQPGDWEDRKGYEKIWMGDESQFHIDPFPKYFSYSPIFKPDKDCGTRRHRKPHLPKEKREGE